MKKLAILFIALFSAAAFAQDLPKIAVYIASDNVAVREKKSLMTRLQSKFVKSGRYKVTERSGTFLAEIENEHLRQRSGDIDDSQIIKLGKQYGAEFICIVDIMASIGTFDVSARIISVETVEIVNIGYCFSPLQTTDDLEKATEELAKQLLGEQPMLAQKSKPESEPTSELTPLYAELPEEQTSILIMTLPSFADIYIDERFIGKANSGELEVPVGTYEVRFVKDGIDKTTTMTFRSGKNPPQYIPLNRESATLLMSSSVASASYPKSENENFTIGHRFVAIGLNLLIPGLGLGSFTMLDGWGALTQMALVWGGIPLILNEFDTYEQERTGMRWQNITNPFIDYPYGNQNVWVEYTYTVTEKKRNDVWYTIGLGAVSCGITYAILRPAFKKKPNYMSSLENADVNFAVLPDKDGNIKGYVAYRMEF